MPRPHRGRSVWFRAESTNAQTRTRSRHRDALRRGGAPAARHPRDHGPQRRGAVPGGSARPRQDAGRERPAARPEVPPLGRPAARVRRLGRSGRDRQPPDRRRACDRAAGDRRAQGPAGDGLPRRTGRARPHDPAGACVAGARARGEGARRPLRHAELRLAARAGPRPARQRAVPGVRRLRRLGAGAARRRGGTGRLGRRARPGVAGADTRAREAVAAAARARAGRLGTRLAVLAGRRRRPPGPCAVGQGGRRGWCAGLERRRCVAAGRKERVPQNREGREAARRRARVAERLRHLLALSPRSGPRTLRRAAS